MALPTSPCPKVIEDPVELALLLQVQVIVPNPSASANVFDAVSVSPWVAVPLIVTLPVGASLTFATAEVAEDATLSSVPRVSV